MNQQDKDRVRKIYEEQTITPGQAVEQYMMEKRFEFEAGRHKQWSKNIFLLLAFIVFLISTCIISFLPMIMR